MRDGVQVVTCSRCGEVSQKGFDGGPIQALLWHWRAVHGAIPQPVFME